MANLQKRFEEKYIPEPNSGCWLWIAAIGNNGYGIIGTDSYKVETAHRVSWKLYHGEIPDDKWVLHRCDVRSCVNPNHLYLGNVSDNTRDLMERGKPFCYELKKYKTPETERKRIASLPRGKFHHRSTAKLTEEQVRIIFNANGSQRTIAAKFGICQQLVSRIKLKLAWSHIHGD